MSQSEKSTASGRRKFILGGLFASIGSFFAMMFYPVWRFIMPPPIPESQENSIVVGKVDEFKPNSGKLFGFGSKPAILIRTPSGEFRAFSAVCPHLQCTVQYREDFKQIWCACHNARFDLNGGVASGPPPAPLEIFDVNLNNDDIIVSKRL